MIKAFPKIFALGTTVIADVLKEPVEITEKIDGSQFCFGKINGELFLRSKRKQLFPENADKMFKPGVDYIMSIQDRIPDNCTFFCEYLARPKHNVLAYDRIPKNHFMVFGASDRNGIVSHYSVLEWWAKELDIEPIPLFSRSFDFADCSDVVKKLESILDSPSALGGQKIEGVVMKNYNRSVMMGDVLISDGVMCAKYVSERFKEKHQKDWKERKGKAPLEMLFEKYRSEARWRKAIQHLQEEDGLEFTPRDIGKLIKEIQTDLIEEEKEEIKNDLWKLFNGNFLRKAIAGFPEWYKKFLVERTYEEKE